MAAKSRPEWDYVAHVQKPDGSIAEIAGRKEAYHMKQVWHYLFNKAQDLGGWLLAEHITPAEGAQAPEETPPCTYKETVEDPTPTIGCTGVWSEFNGRMYKGATRLTFKE